MFIFTWGIFISIYIIVFVWRRDKNQDEAIQWAAMTERGTERRKSGRMRDRETTRVRSLIDEKHTQKTSENEKETKYGQEFLQL